MASDPDEILLVNTREGGPNEHEYSQAEDVHTTVYIEQMKVSTADPQAPAPPQAASDK